MREMEVLQDIILEMFEKSPELVPGDVLVMMPDIEMYAPFVHAVFDLSEGDPRRIPYRVADRSSSPDRLAMDTFMAILDLPLERFAASKVMEIIRSPLVARRFQIDEKGLIILEDLIRGSGIRWGLDDAAKAAIGLPPGNENTWKAGLERLLLGYAMPGFGERIFKGVVPYDHIEGKDFQILGNLIDFIERLRFLDKELRLSHSPGEWSAILTTILDEFFEDGVEGSLRKLQKAISDLLSLEEDAGFRGLLELPVIKEHLRDLLEGEGLGRGFMDSGMTFCAMVPMRSIPRRVICLAGLNGEGFPGRSSSPDFDLIASNPKRCDRSRRKDDRYLFLEALLSARDTFCITYVGQDIKDNSTIPPSVLVSDLMDYVEKAFVPEEGGKILDKVVIRHRLQAFSPAYFEGGRLFSYSRSDFDAARALCDQSEGEPHFFSRPLAEQEESFDSIGIESLSSFFVNPCRFLLKRRLGVNLEDAEAGIEDEEPFELAGLERYKIAQELLEKEMNGQDPGYLFPVKKAAGELPYGTMGRLEYLAIARRSHDLAGTIADFISPGKGSVATINLKISGRTITGTVRGIFGSRIVRCRNAAIGGKDRIRLWIELLLLSCSEPERRQLAGVLAGWSKGPELIEIRAPEKAGDLLSELIDFYKEGLKAPLRFFPEASWRYAFDVASRGVSPEKALAGAIAAWGSEYGKSREKDDPYIRLCFGKEIPLDGKFQKISFEIFAPLISEQSV
jgi:exodeoxyribonuclease V gamma subunit